VRLAIVLSLVVALAAGCRGKNAVRIHVTPATSVEDEAVRISVNELAPRQHVRLDLRSVDSNGVIFSSHASFVADGSGRVDLATARPLRGSGYTTAWPMGLLTSMTAPKAPAFAFYKWKDSPRQFVVRASSRGRLLSTVSFTRRWRRGVYTKVKTTVRRNGFEGTFYAPAGARRHAAVLAFGGSEGGEDGAWEGERLAAHGIPTLSVAYFQAPGLPNRLVNIPLEYFRTALKWLGRRTEVDPSRIGVLSGSYGAEAALLLAVHYPKLVHKVAALSPSSVVTCGISGVRGSACLGSPWTFRGQPLPHTAIVSNPHPWDDPRAAIPVERIHGDVLLACGIADERWSSCSYARSIVARRRAKDEATRLYVYPHSGHYVDSPALVYEPGALAQDLLVPQTELAREDLWPHLLAFLGATR
jgi:pimeloyl-ACP methyl ester carboxylesterase